VKLSAQIGTEEREVVVDKLADGRYRLIIDGGAERIIDARRLAGGAWSMLLGDDVVTVDVEPGKDGDLLVDVRGTVVPVKIVDPRRKLMAQARTAKVAHGPTPVTSPMPGKVVKLLVKAGDAVTAGQGVAVVEAMKMENEIRAPRAGTVLGVHVKEGQAVEGQEGLVTIE
jgi:biotin carboxyl carrier protein